MSDKSINTIAVGDIFESGTYVIPIYQRNYAWQESEVKQLIQDIRDFSEAHPNKNYFIGTLIVFERNDAGKTIYETIDGQQRLTTLNILYAVLHKEFTNELAFKINYRLNLKFDARKISSNSLEYISQIDSRSTFDTGEEFNSNIQDAYEVAKKFLKSLFGIDNQKLQNFYNYLSQKVNILRVSVPKDTDLNHYFEIMNTRGEQLEKHEILKAKLMKILSDDEQSSYAFNKIWEACSDMERYIQYGFTTRERDRIFSAKNWNNLSVNTFEEFANLIEFNGDAENTITLNLEKIVSHAGNFEYNSDHKEEAPERFNSIINFPNFLLHILRVQTKEDISLDDKRLLEPFEEYLTRLITKEDKINFVKYFAFNLLKGKFLFDRYIIKREFAKEKDGWSLKNLKWYDGNKVSYVNTFDNEEDNRRILMLLSMFHVSAPTLIYKHWLNASLFFLFKNSKNINSKIYVEWLENLAQAYLYDRYLALDEAIDFYEIIYKNKAIPQNKSVLENHNWDNLNAGTSVENFIFNYLDYILWVEKSDGYNDFDFSFRSSVEHYYPQNPISSDDKLDQNILDKFGNLCLISRSKNSTLGRYMPKAKTDHYVRVKPDSLKQKLMMNEPIWEKEQINNHTEYMIQKLKQYNYAITN
ncbi:MAG TPA: DUF262 domain-containing protein [Chryseobacterium sp.]|nr:DUF262 domain-containing protein [Chryseobacterium sp.]